MQSMICSNCGAEVRETTRFCPRCGRAANPVAGVPAPVDLSARAAASYAPTTFSKNTVRSILASLAILVVAISSIVFIDAQREQMTLIERLKEAQAGNLRPADVLHLQDDVRHSDSRIRNVSKAWAGWLVVAGIVYLFWVHRAYENLRAFRVGGLRRTPGGAVVAFFIPIANLWLPFPMARELWRASSLDVVDSTSTGALWYRASVTPLIALWWVAFIVSTVLLRLSGVFKPSVRTPDDYQKLHNYDLFIVGDLIVLIAAAALAVIVLQLITSRQRDVDAEMARRQTLVLDAAPLPAEA